MLNKELIDLFNKREFFGAATCDFKGRETV